jgi:predicted exporter
MLRYAHGGNALQTRHDSTYDNAVMTQLMTALCVYLILAYLKFQSRIQLSLQQIIRLVHINLFTRRDLPDLFKPPDQKVASPQLGLL